MLVAQGFLTAQAVFTILAGQLAVAEPARPSRETPRAAVVANDNRQPAGTFKDSTLVLELRAAEGLWRPEGDAGPALRIEAFGEGKAPLSVPAPLIRVQEGTSIVASIRNDLDVILRVHGLCTRGTIACTPMEVPPAATREVRFASGPAGTYHYWATTTGMPQGFRGADDTQLSGAFIVDPPGAAPDADRVFVITEWTNLTREQLRAVVSADNIGVAFLALDPKFTFLINGLSWPATERLTYRLGESVRWRIINLSTQRHPMHLHGFYYEIDSLGDGMKESTSEGVAKQRVVTQLLQPGATMAMTWKPERAGNWLFHCHIVDHVSPERRLGEPAAHADHYAGHQSSAGMAAMVLGVTVLGSDHTPAEAASVSPTAPRKLTLVMQSEAKRYGDAPAYGFVLAEGDHPPSGDHVSVPGPTLVLRREEPVEITLVNRLPEGTAIHWHGMELESYYDGVHGWSGVGQRVTPLIEPGGTFVVRFTPPRAGTFMYHTHLHDSRQLASGLYGPMLVLEPGETFDAMTDHVFIMGRGGPGVDAPAVLNGDRSPQFVWKAGKRHRVRLINITRDDVLVVSLQTMDGPITWRPLTKDGAPLPPHQCAPRPARQAIAVGETYDFEYDAPEGRQNLWMEVRSTGGKWQVQGHVIVK